MAKASREIARSMWLRGCEPRSNQGAAGIACPICESEACRPPDITGPLEAGRPICFRCRQTAIARRKALRRLAALNTASDARFQECLPFEPVNKGRLELLRSERAAVRSAADCGPDRFEMRIRDAQIAARRALQELAGRADAPTVERQTRDQALALAIHAAEEQLPDSWLPYVVDTAAS